MTKKEILILLTNKIEKEYQLAFNKAERKKLQLRQEQLDENCNKLLDLIEEIESCIDEFEDTIDLIEDK